MLPIKKMLTMVNYTEKKDKKNKYIVIHWVGAVSSAYSNARYFQSQYRGSSAHYIVDDDDIYQVVEDSDSAWHCGAKKYYHDKCRNSNSIGVEMCLKSKDTISDETIQNTAELVQYLMKKYKIPSENVIRHYDVTRKQCPAPYVKETEWSVLLKILVGEQMKKKQYIKIKFVGTDGKGLAVRKKPSCDATPVYYIKNTGDVFTVIRKVKVREQYMYQTKSGLYITASSKYVEYYTRE